MNRILKVELNLLLKAEEKKMNFKGAFVKNLLINIQPSSSSFFLKRE